MKSVNLCVHSLSKIGSSDVTDPLVKKDSMYNLHTLKKAVLFLLTLIGGGTVLFSAGAAALDIARNHSPDSLVELISPDHRYRIVITEELAGFPGSSCIKQVYVLPADDTFDRNDEDNEVFVGGCQGLTAVRWNGDRIQGTVALKAAVEGVSVVRLKGFAAKGKVQLIWSAR
ncbi:hypothetical protein ACHAC9_13980 [Massilia sp. CMS3.1]|uniref:hypothetical protein n=1 Tax=Massilia sp. CMS3.1 TaxID=3373083 RepID=UPI003EE58521